MALNGGLHGGLAGEDILTSRFIKHGSSDGVFLEGNADDVVHGISHDGSRNVPALGLSTVNTANSGDPMLAYGMGDICLLTIGSGGVTRGDRIKCGAAGVGLAAAGTATSYAIAIQSIASGETGYVQFTGQQIGDTTA